jgi:hypothetical protein
LSKWIPQFSTGKRDESSANCNEGFNRGLNKELEERLRESLGGVRGRGSRGAPGNSKAVLTLQDNN